jgi:hypothetical protein
VLNQQSVEGQKERSIRWSDKQPWYTRSKNCDPATLISPQREYHLCRHIVAWSSRIHLSSQFWVYIGCGGRGRLVPTDEYSVLCEDSRNTMENAGNAANACPFTCTPRKTLGLALALHIILSSCNYMCLSSLLKVQSAHSGINVRCICMHGTQYPSRVSKWSK